MTATPAEMSLFSWPHDVDILPGDGKSARRDPTERTRTLMRLGCEYDRGRQSWYIPAGVAVWPVATLAWTGAAMLGEDDLTTWRRRRHEKHIYPPETAAMEWCQENIPPWVTSCAKPRRWLMAAGVLNGIAPDGFREYVESRSGLDDKGAQDVVFRQAVRGTWLAWD